MNVAIRKFLRDEDGITALEYGILAALVAGVLVITVAPQLTKLFGVIFTNLTTAANTTPAAGS